MSTFFTGKNEQFRLENASNLRYEFSYDNFNKKILQNFFVEIVIKIHVTNMMHFEDEMAHLFFLRKKKLV